MGRAASSLGAAGALLIMFGLSAAAEGELPAGRNRDIVERHCQTCHGLHVLVDTGGMTRADWIAILDQMEGNGLRVTREQRAAIIDYLATYLARR